VISISTQAETAIYSDNPTLIYTTDFHYSDLTGVSFDNVFLDNVSFSHATLTHIPWRNVQGIRDDDWFDDCFEGTQLADRDVRKLAGERQRWGHTPRLSHKKTLTSRSNTDEYQSFS
jgi:uncharacterized protein YjbI with pentapeptide repeats